MLGIVIVTRPFETTHEPPVCVRVTGAPAGVGHDAVVGMPESYSPTTGPVLDDDALAASFEPELDDAPASFPVSPLLPPASPLGSSLDPDEPAETSAAPSAGLLEPLELEPDTPPPVEAPMSDDRDAPAAPSNAPDVSLTPSPFDGL